MRVITGVFIAVSTSALMALPAAASTLPGADERQGTVFGTGVGPGFGVSVDGAISGDTRLGVALGMAMPFGVIPNYDLRLAHWIRTGTPRFDLTLVAGAFGMGATLPLGAEFGAGLAYELVPRLTGRLNILIGTNFVSRVMYGPSSGFELGFAFTPRLEGTIGYNARGEVLGLRVRI
ncbi:MAG: hypothetical protein FJZ01_01250 [Candidatus Sericytochromatia bacterium]|nr:hypothetical protein [Candidatus Tanganyikabacteria bacterium]